VKGLDQQTIAHLKDHNNDTFVQHQLELLERRQVHLISYWDPCYPSHLKRIADAPVLLYFKGKSECLNDTSIAVVGTRNPTPYGRLITERLTKQLAEAGFCIISGLARGVDTLVHRTVLGNDGTTIAVLAGGIDWIYPAENKDLAEEITGRGGLISEYPLGMRPEAMNFPKRNRIISGLSLGVLVTEAGIKSGALITAFNALEQNREVFAVPGPVTSEKSRGTNEIIKEGAKLVQGIEDITEELSGQLDLFESKKKTNQRKLPELDTREEKIISAIGQESVHIDTLALRTGMTTAEILTVLLGLELNGLVKQLSGKMFVRSV
jgi:DNA processing protein